MSRRIMTKEQSTKRNNLQAIREKHGFHTTQNVHDWSKSKLESSNNGVPAQQDAWPKNAPIMNYVCSRFDFLSPAPSWEAWEKVIRSRKGEKREVKGVDFKNWPTVGGEPPTLYDLAVMPVELTDGFSETEEKKRLFKLEGQDSNGFKEVLDRINSTGLGYKGSSGVSWRSGLEPFKFPVDVVEKLLKLGEAIFSFQDMVGELLREGNVSVVEALSYKKPDHILGLSQGKINFIRPDITVVKDVDGNYRFVVTELESAPAGHGILHALQHGYGLDEEMVDSFVDYLQGRSYIVLITKEYVAYLWDQVLFCNQLRDRGIDAKVLFDDDMEAIESFAVQDWKAPEDAPMWVKKEWRTDVRSRLSELGFSDLVFGRKFHDFPTQVGNAVVFRFGYFDNLGVDFIKVLEEWRQAGAEFINGLNFFSESKSMMSLIWNQEVRHRIIENYGEEVLRILDKGVAQTRLLKKDNSGDIEDLRKDKNYWLTKFAAWDGENKSWGARSLFVGSQCSGGDWSCDLSKKLDLSWPSVAQHVISSVRFSVPWVDHDGKIRILHDARTRLTPFFIRNSEGVVSMSGSMMTLRAKSFRIHGATDAVVAPVIFSD